MRSYFLRPPSVIQRLIPRATWHLGNRKHEINLSFDDGPHPIATPKILKLLSIHNVKASFFVLGQHIEKYPSILDEIRSEGHQIGNHGYRHLDGWRTNTQTYINNTKRGADLAESQLFRPPYGRVSIRQYLQLKTQYQLILWSLMTGDFDASLSTAAHADRLRNLPRGGDIIVLHEQERASKMFADGFEGLVALTQQQGLSFSHI